MGTLDEYEDFFINGVPVAFSAHKQSDEFHFGVICAAVPEKACERWIDAVFARKAGESRIVVEWL